MNNILPFDKVDTHRKVYLLNENEEPVTLTNPLPIQLGDSASIDAFGRLRVSNPHTIFDSKMVADKQNLFFDEAINIRELTCG